MKVLNTEISTLENRLLHIERIVHPLLLCRFHHQPEYHSHPELELLYVEKGSGTRVINGKEEAFTDGDMVFSRSEYSACLDGGHQWRCR